MLIEKVMVIGAGQMGAGIAEVCATNGYTVFLYDTNEYALKAGLARIVKNVEKNVVKERISEKEATQILARLQEATSLNLAKETQLVIEAAIENIDIKKSIFKQLDDIVEDTTILATNTSSLPITEIAAVTKRPERVIGMHFMNPVPVMKLVEIIRGLATATAVFESIYTMTEKLKKVPVEVNDFPGFVSNRILMPMINEAIYTLYEGVASVAHIDTVMKLGMNQPMGPLQLADFIGLDTCLYIMETLYEGFADSKYRPCPLLKKYVAAGWCGKKSGRGFYNYES